MNAKWIPCGNGTLLHPLTGEQILTSVVEQKNWGRIFEVFHYNDDPPGTQCLIESAPDLLNALESLLIRASALDQSATHDGIENCKAISIARSAISKAKGKN